MKCTVDRKQLAAALVTAKAVSPRATSSYPVLQNCRLTADADSLTVEATDLDLWASVKLAAAVESPGVLILPTGKLAEIAKGKAASVTIEAAGSGPGELATVAGAELTTLDPGEYPERPKPIEAAPALIPTETLASLYSQTAFAVTKDESRPAMTGLDLEMSKNEVRMIATDGHRLSQAEADCTPGIRGKIIIHPRAVAAIVRKPSGPVADVVAVRQNKTRYSLTCGDTTISARQIEGPYPDWQRVIPENMPLTVRFDRDAMMEALAAVEPFFHPVGKLVSFRFNGTASLHAETPDVGKMTREVACQTTGIFPVTSTVHCECAGLGVVLCPRCHGEGIMHGHSDDSTAECWRCNGTGAKECPKCEGTGKQEITLRDTRGHVLTEIRENPDITIGFNGLYFAEMVKRQGPKCRLELSNPLSCGLFKGKHDTMLLMPIRLD
jgi:DNA polymerase-3 subunit beta